VLLMMQIVPYFMTGFESVAKAAEEASPEFVSSSFLTAIGMAIFVGVLFYAIVIGAVGYVAPWKQLVGRQFLTAVAFENAVGAHWIVSSIMAAALLSLFKCFNGNFVAASRLLFAMGRRGLVDTRIGEVHPANQTPAIAVLYIGTATALCMFLGDAILVPITEVGSVASAAGWLATCAAYYAMGPPPRERIIAAFGIAVGLAMILMKVVPGVPGNFTGYEWLSLAIWIAIGVVLAWRGGQRSQLV
jgi:basic amino acid/polyamine antiporter, APA family